MATTMTESWEATAKPSQVMREVLIIPKPGLGMLALALGLLLFGGASILVAAAVEHPEPVLLGIPCGVAGFFGLPARSLTFSRSLSKFRTRSEIPRFE